MKKADSMNLFVSFHLADPAGILFFSHVYILCHEVFEQCIIEKLGCSWKEWFQNEMWVVPIKASSATYFAPIQAGKYCTVSFSFSGRTTSTFSVEYVLSQEEKKCCAVQITHVFVERAGSNNRLDIPSQLQEKIDASLREKSC